MPITHMFSLLKSAVIAWGDDSTSVSDDVDVSVAKL